MSWIWRKIQSFAILRQYQKLVSSIFNILESVLQRDIFWFSATILPNFGPTFVLAPVRRKMKIIWSSSTRSVFVSKINFLFVTLSRKADIDKRNEFYCINQQNYRRQIFATILNFAIMQFYAQSEAITWKIPLRLTYFISAWHEWIDGNKINLSSLLQIQYENCTKWIFSPKKLSVPISSLLNYVVASKCSLTPTTYHPYQKLWVWVELCSSRYWRFRSDCSQRSQI